MIIEWVARMKRKHNCKVHFESDTFQMKDCIVAPVHLIPKDICNNQEFDFYLETKYDVYLLRIVNKKDKCINIYPAKVNGIIYIVVNLPFNKNNIIESINKILDNLRKNMAFPNLKNPKYVTTFQIDC